VTLDDSRGRWVALIVCCSAMFMTLLDVSVTNVALPSIGDDTGAGASQLQWVVSGYTLAFGLVPVLGGKLGDDQGRRLMFQVGVGGFVVTSALSGLASSFAILFLSRMLMGTAEGGVLPISQSLIALESDEKRRGLNAGVMQNLGSNLIGSSIAPIVLVWIANHYHWRSAFYLAAIPGLICAFPASRSRPMDGSATFVTLTSSSVMNIALQQTIRATQRPRLSSGVTARSCQSVFTSVVEEVAQ
jgi:MFS family permease